MGGYPPIKDVVSGIGCDACARVMGVWCDCHSLIASRGDFVLSVWGMQRASSCSNLYVGSCGVPYANVFL